MKKIPIINPIKKSKINTNLPTYEKLPRYKKFNGKWYILSDIAFTKKYADVSKDTAKEVYGNAKVMKYLHKNKYGDRHYSIEYGIYVKNPNNKYGYNPKKGNEGW